MSRLTWRQDGEAYTNYLTKAVVNKLADYEDKEEQGLLIELPCKVGDVVYHEKPYVTLYTGVQAYQITNIMISQNKRANGQKSIVLCYY